MASMSPKAAVAQIVKLLDLVSAFLDSEATAAYLASDEPRRRRLISARNKLDRIANQLDQNLLDR